jgi:short/branched chain acyl-CoA dehydrogenase
MVRTLQRIDPYDRRNAWLRTMHLDASKAPRPASTMFSESELALQESVATFAKEVIGPKVYDMDMKGEFDPDILKGCFEQGIMGIEAPEEFGGVGLGFTAACIAVEEIARVDPSIAVMIDIHNTLNVASLMKYGTDEQKSQYLPRLCQDTVSRYAARSLKPSLSCKIAVLINGTDGL